MYQNLAMHRVHIDHRYEKRIARLRETKVTFNEQRSSFSNLFKIKTLSMESGSITVK